MECIRFGEWGKYASCVQPISPCFTSITFHWWNNWHSHPTIHNLHRLFDCFISSELCEHIIRHSNHSQSNLKRNSCIELLSKIRIADFEGASCRKLTETWTIFECIDRERERERLSLFRLIFNLINHVFCIQLRNEVLCTKRRGIERRNYFAWCCHWHWLWNLFNYRCFVPTTSTTTATPTKPCNNKVKR